MIYIWSFKKHWFNMKLWFSYILVWLNKVFKMNFLKNIDYFHWTENFIKILKMRLVKRRNKLLPFFVISLTLFLLCHHAIIVEAKAASQVTTNKGETGLSDIFSKYDTNEDGEYYYDDDDPYGIGSNKGEDSDEYADDDYYSYEDSENENSSDGSGFSSKMGKHDGYKIFERIVLMKG